MNQRQHSNQKPQKKPTYNVLHIGGESGAHEHHIYKKFQKAKVLNFLSFFSVGLVFFALLFVNATVNTEAQKNEQTIQSLVDEIGTLSQDNFVLAQQVEAQESSIKHIEEEFMDIEGVVELMDELEPKEPLEEKFKFTPSEYTAAEDSTLDFLILGTNGIHTDTIMIASVNLEKSKVSVFSVPRDLYVNGRRINTYFSSYGMDHLSRMLKQVTGLQIDHYMQVDLEAFVEIVNIIGGVNVFVEEAIYDGLYPSAVGTYSPYSIEVGQYHFDGEDALKYARSRKSTSDFHRAGRQQVILEAIRSKILQMDAVMNTKELAQMFQSFLVHTKTDMSLLDVVSFYSDYKEFEVNSGLVLSVDNHLRSMINQAGAYILVPKTGNYDNIQAAVQELVH